MHIFSVCFERTSVVIAIVNKHQKTMFLLFNQNINHCYFKLLVNKHLRVRYLLIARQKHHHWSPVCVSCGHLRYNERKNRSYLFDGAANISERYFSSNANNSSNTNITVNQSKQQNINEKEEAVAKAVATAGSSSSSGDDGGSIRGDRLLVPAKYLSDVLTPPPDRPVAKTSGFIVIRKLNELAEWYAKTPPKRRANIYASFGIKIGYQLVLIGIVICVAVLMTVDNNNITGRECIISMPERTEKILENEYIAELTKKYIDKFVAPTDHRLQRLDNCFNRLMAANDDIEGIEGQRWVAALIDDNDTSDVVVVGETTTVIVFSKVLEMCDNDHQLAYMLSHAFAHWLLGHRKETTAHTPWYLFPLAIYLPKMYSVFSYDPTVHLKMDDWAIERLKEFLQFVLTFRALPYKQVFEQEADRIGLQLMTRACFDTRESPKFCAKHRELSARLRGERVEQQNDSDNKIVDKTHYLYIHPIDDNRVSYLDALMQPFFDIRNELTECEKLC